MGGVPSPFACFSVCPQFSCFLLLPQPDQLTLGLKEGAGLIPAVLELSLLGGVGGGQWQGEHRCVGLSSRWQTLC